NAGTRLVCHPLNRGRAAGETLGKVERSVAWWIGDWWASARRVTASARLLSKPTIGMGLTYAFAIGLLTLHAGVKF
ncbi:MAG: hypothetical protein ACRECZ_00565, partial [Methylocella sp.]